MATARTDQARWLRQFHQAGDGVVQLICFPHAGGTAGSYFPLSAALAPAVAVRSVQYPGRQDRLAEPPAVSIAELADQLVEVLTPVAARPTAFFGHSMGAIVGYEVALRLAQVGAPRLVGLFVSGRAAPSRQPESRIAEQGEAGVLADVRFLQEPDVAPDLLADPDLRELVLPAMLADYRAIEEYRHQPERRLDCPVTALLGEHDPRVRVAEAAAWSAHTAAEATTRVFPGGHFYLVPRRAEVAQTIRSELARWSRADRAGPTV